MVHYFCRNSNPEKLWPILGNFLAACTLMVIQETIIWATYVRGFYWNRLAASCLQCKPDCGPAKFEILSISSFIWWTMNNPELINSIEITIAIDIFGTIAIAIVKRISQLLLLLLLLIRSSISIDFFHIWDMLFLNFCRGQNWPKRCKSDSITFKSH